MYKSVEKEKIEFNGDVITIKFNRLTRAQFMSLQPFFENAQNGNVNMSFEDTAAFFDVVDSVVPDRLVHFSGIEVDDQPYVYNKDDENSGGFLFDCLLKEATFVELVQKILAAMITASAPDIKTADEGLSPEKKQKS